MPTAPVSSGPQVQPGNMPGVMLNPGSVSPEAFGAGLARGFQGLSGTLNELYQEERKKADDIALTDAITGAYKADTRHRYSTGDDGSLPGFAVMEGDQLFSNAAKVSQSFHKDLSGIAEKLTPSQRARFVQGTQGLMHGFESSMAVRIAQERHRRNAESTGNAVSFIANSVGQLAARDPDQTTPEAVGDSVSAIELQLRSGAARAPSPPPSDVLDVSIQTAQYGTTDNVLKQLLQQEKFSRVQAILDDQALAPTIRPNMRSHSLEMIKKHKENAGVYDLAEAAFLKAQAAVSADLEMRGFSIEEKTAAMRAKAKALVGVEYVENGQGRGRAVDAVEAMLAQDYREKVSVNAGRTERFSKQLMDGELTLNSIMQLPEYADLSVSQRTQIGAIHVARTMPSTRQMEERHQFVTANWQGLLNAPVNVKKALAETNIQFTGVPAVKELVTQPLRERERNPIWPVILQLNPELGAEVPGNAQIKAAQAKLEKLWPSSPKDLDMITGLQKQIQSDFAKVGDKWDSEYERIATRIAEQQMQLMNPSVASSILKAKTAEHLSLLQSAKASLPTYEKRQEPPKEEDMLSISSKLLVTKAVEKGSVWDSSYTFEQLQKANANKQVILTKDRRIPLKNIAPSWRADIESTLVDLGQKPSDDAIERSAYAQWYKLQSTMRKKTFIKP